jgi:hypothetical protein
MGIRDHPTSPYSPLCCIGDPEARWLLRILVKIRTAFSKPNDYPMLNKIVKAGCASLMPFSLQRFTAAA